LQQVRDELGSGAAPAVSEAALRGGFEHLGRFARYYRVSSASRPRRSYADSGRDPATHELGIA